MKDTGSLPGKLSFSALSSLPSTDVGALVDGSGRLALSFSATTSCSSSLRSACAKAPAPSASAAFLAPCSFSFKSFNLARACLFAGIWCLHRLDNGLAATAGSACRLRQEFSPPSADWARWMARVFDPSSTISGANHEAPRLFVLRPWPLPSRCRRSSRLPGAGRNPDRHTAAAAQWCLGRSRPRRRSQCLRPRNNNRPQAWGDKDHDGVPNRYDTRQARRLRRRARRVGPQRPQSLRL